MPAVGTFHAKFWRARANVPPPPGADAGAWQYPRVQSALTHLSSLFGALQVLYEQLVWVVALVRRMRRYDAEQQAVIARVCAALESPHWPTARVAVRACATTPKFQSPTQWVEYGRALKSNAGQAQNVFRHVKVVGSLRGLHDGPAPISNPEAHLLAELAYQGFAAVGRPRRAVMH